MEKNNKSSNHRNPVLHPITSSGYSITTSASSVSQNTCLRFNRTAVFPLDGRAQGGVRYMSIIESWAENQSAIVFPPLAMPGGGAERSGACRSLVSEYLFLARSGTRGSVLSPIFRFDYISDSIPPLSLPRDNQQGVVKGINQ